MSVTQNPVELKAALAKQADLAKEALNSMTEEQPGKFVMSTEAKTAYQSAIETANEIKAHLAMVEEVSGLSAAASEPVAEFKSAAMSQAAVDAHKEIQKDYSPSELKSIGEAFVESAEYKAFQAAGGHGQGDPFDSTEVKDVYSALAPTTTPLVGFGRTETLPMLMRQHRTARVRDLFNARSTTANLIEFYRVTGLVNNAAVVPERAVEDTVAVFGKKPQSTLTFAPEQAPVRTIAHWEAAHRTVLADEPQLRGIIDDELMYGLRLTEDAQLLTGSGSGENIRGLLNTPNIQVYLQSSGPVTDNKADAVRRAITKVILAEYESTGVVLNPLDWEDVELTKDDNGGYIISTGVATGAQKRLWQLPVVATPVIAEGTFLTGAFGLGAQIYDREAPNIRMADQHQDFFVRNALVILAEQRLALAVPRPEAFVKGTFS